jgi:hypothetical protein
MQITKEIFNDVFNTDATGATDTISHIYGVTGPEDLQKIVTVYVNCELADGDHDLQRKGDQTNPLVEYCKKNTDKRSYINGQFVNFNYQYTGDCTSQLSIKKKMEELIKDKTFNNRLPLEKTTQKIPKKLTNLQEFLFNNEVNGFGQIQSSIVETHRGGSPNNESSQTHSTMYKSNLTTTFDLGSNENFVRLTVGEIIPTVGYLNNRAQNLKLPLLRFYPNYFPNAFSVFIKKDEFNNKIMEIITPYFKDNPSIYIQTETEADKISKLIKNINNNELVILHMFTDKNAKPTYSLQYGQVKADDVTMQLYGEKKRSILGCFKDLNTFKPEGIIFEEGMSLEMKSCHVLYGKTCGDGVTIEAANMYSYLKNETTNVLSNDFCCNLRASFVTGFSTRQAPTSLAGTGLGSFFGQRDTEFFKSTTISGGKTMNEIYADNIVKNFYDINFSGNDSDSDSVKNQLTQHISEKLKDGYDKNQFLGHYVNIFVDKKMNDINSTIESCAQLISKVLKNQLKSVEDKDLFEKVGKFNLNNIKGEVDEYASSFGKIILRFNDEFSKIFRNRDGNMSKYIEDGISFVSSIEEKLKECSYNTSNNESQMETQQDATAANITNLNDSSDYKSVVFVFLSTYLNDISDNKIVEYCTSIFGEVKDIIQKMYDICPDGTLKNTLKDAVDVKISSLKLSSSSDISGKFGTYYKNLLNY